ncbi:hypothetical protein CK501_05745 [Halovibrio salipaludis]|uniref:Uncharacterized protein n=1 Tax=Halovibrio salipaludis TaxID=2032626 RepID=A0A2A2F8Z9_9GAMM|nr:hypothetical protein [Halovibrio salipaludis]PAU81065.1 hypothetical protein CK501_05745 [Halovibrio salipaludis]
MRLPKRPNDLTPATARLVDGVLVELYEIRHVHELAEAGEDHRGNRADAAQAHDELRRLLADAPASLEQWAKRARYVADIMLTELMGSNAA